MVDGVSSNYQNYTVRSGDNLFKIARRYNTTVGAILQLNPEIKVPNRIYVGQNFKIPDNQVFVQKEDYNPKNMNLGKVTIDGQEVGQEFKTNLYANNFASLYSNTLQSGNLDNKVVVEMQAGKDINQKDNTAYSILNKFVFDHIDNNSTVYKDQSGNYVIKNQYLESTDLYKAFISEEVNGDNFDENKTLNRSGNNGNKVQIPALKVDSNGVKYFTLQSDKEGTLYFDSTGKRVQMYKGVIQGATEIAKQPQPIVTNNQSPQVDFNNETFDIENSHDDRSLNLGKFYVNGNVQHKSNNAQGNFYRNNVNMFMEQTLNDTSKASRLDVQLNLGAEIQTRDTGAVDILKKMLGTNFDKASKIKISDEGKVSAYNTPLADTELYKAFVSQEVNGNNFENNKIVKSENGFNIVQFPALEVDENGAKYYVLHKTNGEILYFDDAGNSIKP